MSIQKYSEKHIVTPEVMKIICNSSEYLKMTDFEQAVFWDTNFERKFYNYGREISKEEYLKATQL